MKQAALIKICFPPYRNWRVAVRHLRFSPRHVRLAANPIGARFDEFAPYRELGFRPRQHALCSLYAAECQLFAQIDARMTAFIQEKLSRPHEDARRLQKDFYAKYGTTMSGLMNEHDVCPDEFLAFVHDIDLSPIGENRALAAALEKLPGRRFIFTNASVQHAENVAGRLPPFRRCL